MANTNIDTHNNLLAHCFEYLVVKKHEFVTELCSWCPDGPLMKLSIDEDTVLHLAARSKQRDLVVKLLEMLPEDRKNKLAEIRNKDRNTILHEVATSDDMKDVAKKMLDNNPNLLTARNASGETPIFCAARHGQTSMFKFLAEEMKLKEKREKDGKRHLKRGDGTTALHISITTECFGLAHFIAESYSYLIKEKDQDSMTALQHLACNTSVSEMPNFQMRRHFLKNFINKESVNFMEDIMNSKSKDGPTKKFEVLCDYLNNVDWSRSVHKPQEKLDERNYLDQVIKILVKEDTSWDARVDAQNSMEAFGDARVDSQNSVEEAFGNARVDAQNSVEEASELSQEKEGKISQGSSTNGYNKSIENPLFLAITSNIPEIVIAILIYKPRAFEHTNKEGMNILQVAILYRCIEIFDMVVERFEGDSRRLLSVTDNEGNSLLHMVGQKRKSQVSEKMQNPALALRKELLLFEKVKKVCKLHVTKPLNKDYKTAEELFATSNKKLHQEAKEWLMRTTENCTILSVFIATVAFAAAYTVPGGPNQDTGIPILGSKPSFVVFILADMISLTLALTSVGIFLSILTSSFPLEDFKQHLFKKLIQGIVCLILSVSMMAVAFGATITLIMKHNWKNVFWYVVAFLPVPIFFLSYSPLRSALLRTGIRESSKIVVILRRTCKELFRTVAKACQNICKPILSICGNTSDAQSQKTADSDTEV